MFHNIKCTPSSNFQVCIAFEYRERLEKARALGQAHVVRAEKGGAAGDVNRVTRGYWSAPP